MPLSIECILSLLYKKKINFSLPDFYFFFPVCDGFCLRFSSFETKEQGILERGSKKDVSFLNKHFLELSWFGIREIGEGVGNQILTFESAISYPILTIVFPDSISFCFYKSTAAQSVESTFKPRIHLFILHKHNFTSALAFCLIRPIVWNKNKVAFSA